MWLLTALVTDTVPWEHPDARSSLPAVSVPARDPSCLSGSGTGGVPAEPSPCLRPALPPWLCFLPPSAPGLPAGPLGRAPQPPQPLSPAPPPALPPVESPGLAPPPNPVPPRSLGAWHVWLFRARECFGGNSPLSWMFLSTRYVFSCLPPTPRISTAGLQPPCGGSIPSHGPPSWRRVLGSAVPHGRHLRPHLPPAHSQRPQPCFGGGWLPVPSFTPAPIAWRHPAPALSHPAPACT